MVMISDSKQADSQQHDPFDPSIDALEGCVQHLESKTSMPPLLEAVQEKEACGQYAILLYCELAEVHKKAIIPFIPRITASVVRSLSLSSGGSQLHTACARVVSTVARYTVDPTEATGSNHEILCILCSPLPATLCGKLKPASLGAAVCLQALVESEKWRFAHDDLKSLLCDKVSFALTQVATPVNEALLNLMKSLTKSSWNAALVHASKWLRTGLELLQAIPGRLGPTLQQHIAATQLITSILNIGYAEGVHVFKMADADRTLYSDLQMAIYTLEARRLSVESGSQTEVVEALDVLKRVISSVTPHGSATWDAASFQSSYSLRCENSCTAQSNLQVSKLLTCGILLPGIASTSSPSNAAKSGIRSKYCSSLCCLNQMKENSVYDNINGTIVPLKMEENAPGAVSMRQAFSEASTSSNVSSDHANCLYVLPNALAPTKDICLEPCQGWP